MRRTLSSQQGKASSLGIEILDQCMQKQPLRALRSSPRSPGWFPLLLVSLVGLTFLFALWVWLPPGTVIGVTAQAQAQAHQQARARQQAAGEAARTSADDATTTRSNSAHLQDQAAQDARASIATGASLSRQAQQQLREQHQAAAAAAAAAASGHPADAHGAGRVAFRGGSTTRATTTAASSTALGTGSMASSGPTQRPATGPQAGGPPAAIATSARVVVVGGGLAGLAAALQAAECLAGAANCPADRCGSGGGSGGGGGGGSGDGGGGGAVASGNGSSGEHVEVLVVEKMPKLGGNSAKASSGINALRPEGGDSEALFEDDVVTSGGGASKEELVEQLVRSSPAAIAFLEAHGVVLPGVTRLGGHSVPRTRTVTGGANVGWVIMSALITAVKSNPRIRVLEGYSLRRIVTSAAETAQGPYSPRRVTAVEVAPAGGPDGTAPGSAAAAAAGSSSAAAATAGGSAVIPCGSLVLATGGFAANKDLLRTVAPEAADLATTNGAWARGEALQLARAAGAALVGLEDVQVHPTGFVDPADSAAGTKFLAPEKLRGVGGLLLNEEGRRFVDELARRDVVSGAMSTLPGRTAWLLLGRDAGAEYGQSALDFYCMKGLMTKADTVAAAAQVVGVPEARLREELSTYLAAAAASAAAAAGAASHGGPHGDGGRDSGGTAAFKRVFPHPPDPETQLPFYLARVTPVVHYTMGGVAINERAEVLLEGGGGAVIGGLYAAGEVSGGLHGHNRLGGNSLLECAVFGRIAGAQAAHCSAAP